MTKTLNLAKALVDFTGEEIKDGDVPMTLGKAIAAILTRTESKDPLRDYILGSTFYNNDTLEINKSDLEFVIDRVKHQGPKLYQPIVTGQVLDIINEKEADTKTDGDPKKE